jgi:LPPG:FO 2-phospho-L-lactate transferase
MSSHAPIPTAPRVTAISGGLGGARFALALKQESLADRATFVTNVADDWLVDGLLVAPDTDAVLYALEGRFDEERGWGVLGDTFPTAGTGTGSGSAPWFSLGELDRQRHVRRSALLGRGLTVSEATSVIAGEAGLAARVLPATDAARGTVVVTAEGSSAFQEWLVRDHAAPDVLDVRWPGADQPPSPGVLAAIHEADVVVLTSSSPVASLEPTLTLAGVRDALQTRSRGGRPTVLLSPVVGSTPTTDRDRRRHHARAQLLAARGVAHEPAAVASLFADLVTHVVLDPADADRVGMLPSGLEGVVAPIVAQDPTSRRLLVEACLSPLLSRQERRSA